MLCIWKVLGSCDFFEERQVGNERFNIFSGCPSAHTATIVLRGGADQVCRFDMSQQPIARNLAF